MSKKIQIFFLFLIVSWGMCQELFAVPSQVMIVRHGEKPKDKKAIYLDKKGVERASALAPYFMGTKELLEYGPPVAVYAMELGNIHGHSMRPIETCAPTAEALRLPLNTNYKRDHYAEMVKEIMSDPKLDGKNVLICWEHFKIPAIAQAFGIQNPPDPWSGKVFDRTWVIQFNPDGSVKSFQNLPQRLLFGDSPE